MKSRVGQREARATPRKADQWKRAVEQAKRSIDLLRDAKTSSRRSFELADQGIPETSWTFDEGIRDALYSARSKIAAWVGFLEHARDLD